jgi:transposase
MSRRPPLILDESSRLALEQMRDRHAKPYMRERAASLLKIADGMAPARVAREGLLKPRHADTVYAWLDRYLAKGIAGLEIEEGRGRKPAFSPSGQGDGDRRG